MNENLDIDVIEEFYGVEAPEFTRQVEQEFIQQFGVLIFQA